MGCIMNNKLSLIALLVVIGGQLPAPAAALPIVTPNYSSITPSTFEDFGTTLWIPEENWYADGSSAGPDRPLNGFEASGDVRFWYGGLCTGTTAGADMYNRNTCLLLMSNSSGPGVLTLSGFNIGTTTFGTTLAGDSVSILVEGNGGSQTFHYEAYSSSSLAFLDYSGLKSVTFTIHGGAYLMLDDIITYSEITMIPTPLPFLALSTAMLMLVAARTSGARSFRLLKGRSNRNYGVPPQSRPG
jgi:hypothetical protein